MKCDAIELAPIAWNLSRAASNSRSVWKSREGILVRIRAGGIVGVGEASPLPGFSTESLDDCRRALERAKGLILGTTFDGPDAIRAAVARAVSDAPSGSFALETAMLDAVARSRGVPLWRLFNESPCDVPINALAREETPERVVEEAEHAVARGIRHLKLKIGRPGEFDRERRVVEAVTRACPSVRVRLDANGAWGVEEARHKLSMLEPYAVDLVEEPVAGDAWFALGKVPLTLGIDESLRSPRVCAALEGLAETTSCRVVVLKPAIHGFFASLDLAARAGRFGFSIVITHTFDGPIATAAAAEVALALTIAPLACGLDTFGRGDDWSARAVRILTDRVVPGVWPGLGVEPT